MNEHPHDQVLVNRIRQAALPEVEAIGKLPNFNRPSKHAAGRVGKKRPKRRNRRKP